MWKWRHWRPAATESLFPTCPEDRQSDPGRLRQGLPNADIIAALWPNRRRALVSVTGYLITNAAPLPPKSERAWWYQFYFATERDAFENPDYVSIVIDNYRWRPRLAPATQNTPTWSRNWQLRVRRLPTAGVQTGSVDSF
jgi:hypothetical protein